MGSFDSSQIADLVGIYILDKPGWFLNLSNIGIYRNDRVVSIRISNGLLKFKIQKKVIRAFKYMEWMREIGSNLKIANFLDVTLNINVNLYKP